MSLESKTRSVTSSYIGQVWTNLEICEANQ
jgi:hypothetical protein